MSQHLADTQLVDKPDTELNDNLDGRTMLNSVVLPAIASVCPLDDLSNSLTSLLKLVPCVSTAEAQAVLSQLQHTFYEGERIIPGLTNELVNEIVDSVEHISPLHLVPIIVHGSVTVVALQHGGPHMMLRRCACTWSRQRCCASMSSARLRRHTEPSSQLSVSRVDTGLAAMHQTVLPCDEMECCSGSVGGGQGHGEGLQGSHHL